MKVHSEIGPGFKEIIYHRALLIELEKIGYQVFSEKQFQVLYQDKNVGAFRVDLLVDSQIVVELKSVTGMMPKLFQTQIISYLKASSKDVGLLINFGNNSLEVKRFANDRNRESAKSLINQSNQRL